MEKEKLEVAQENQKLKELLLLHNIAYTSLHGSSPANPIINDFTPSIGGETLLGTNSPSYGDNGSDFSGRPHARSLSVGGQPLQDFSHVSPQGTVTLPSGGPQGTDQSYDQVGIDFVLTYDRQPYISPPP
jgi:hypothetical protein